MGKQQITIGSAYCSGTNILQNWRALVVTLAVIVPLLPALANKVTPQTVPIPDGLQNLFAINWLYGFVLSVVLFYVLHKLFPDRQTLIPATITGDEVAQGVVEGSDGNSDNATEKGLHYNPPVELVEKTE